MAVIVYAIDRVAPGRSSAHVAKEGLKAVRPFVAHADASAAVAFIRCIGRILTTVLHVCPRVVLDGRRPLLVVAPCFSMGNVRLHQAFRSLATATMRSCAQQFVLFDRARGATYTPTAPIATRADGGSPSLADREANYGQRREHSTGEIDRLVGPPARQTLGPRARPARRSAAFRSALERLSKHQYFRTAVAPAEPLSTHSIIGIPRPLVQNCEAAKSHAHRYPASIRPDTAARTTAAGCQIGLTDIARRAADAPASPSASVLIRNHAGFRDHREVSERVADGNCGHFLMIPVLAWQSYRDLGVAP